MKKYIVSIISGLVLGGMAFAATAGIPISVPSSPSGGYFLVSTSTGVYIATTTSPAHFGSVYATSTTATSTLPRLTSTGFSTTWLCLIGDTCRTTWPTGGGGGGVGWATTTSDNESIYFYGLNNVGIGSSTPSAKLGIKGAGVSTGRTLALSDNTNLEIFNVTDNGFMNWYRAATTTIVSGNQQAWNIATGTTVTNNPLFSIDTTGTDRTGTTTINTGLTIDGGAMNYDFSSGVSSMDNLNLGGISFDSDAGQVTLADIPLSSTPTLGTVESYTANIGGQPLMTFYGESNGGGSIYRAHIGIGTTTPTNMLEILAGSTTPSTTGKVMNYSGIYLDNQATSSTAGLIKSGIHLYSSGSWTGTNVGLYVDSQSGGGNNYDAIFNGGGSVGIGTTTPIGKFGVTAGGSGTGAISTTTITFGEIGTTTSTVCYNTKNTTGADTSFYFVGTTMVVEANKCK